MSNTMNEMYGKEVIEYEQSRGPKKQCEPEN